MTEDERREIAAIVSRLSRNMGDSGEIVREIANRVNDIGLWKELGPLFQDHLKKHAEAFLIVSTLLEKITPDEEKNLH